MSYTLDCLKRICQVYLADAPFELQFAGRRPGKGIAPGNAADCRWHGGGWLIRLDPSRRQHWLDDTLHEVGHILLHHLVPCEPGAQEPSAFEKELALQVLRRRITEAEALRRLAEYEARVAQRARGIKAEQEAAAEAWAAQEASRWRAIYEMGLAQDGF